MPQLDFNIKRRAGFKVVEGSPDKPPRKTMTQRELRLFTVHVARGGEPRATLNAFEFGKLIERAANRITLKNRKLVAVLRALAGFVDETGNCFPSNKTLAERAGTTPRSVQRILRVIEDKLGLISTRMVGDPEGGWKWDTTRRVIQFDLRRVAIVASSPTAAEERARQRKSGHADLIDRDEGDR